MAVLFVDDGGSNTSPFDTWAKAADGSNTGGLKAALADGACVAGSAVYIGHNSTTTYTASAIYASQGTFAAPVNIYSVTSGDETTYNVGAIEENSNAGSDLTFTGFANYHGVHFKSIDIIVPSDVNSMTYFTDCHLELTGTSSGDYIGSPSFTCNFKLIDSDLTFGGVLQGINLWYGAVFDWFGGTLNYNVNELIEIHNNRGCRIRVRGVDLSIMTGAGTKFLMNGFGTATDEAGMYAEFIGCKLAASNPPVLVQDVPGVDGVYVFMRDCGSASIPQTQIHTSQGNVYLDTATYKNSSAMYDGANEYSYKTITTAQATERTPLRFQLCEQWMAANPTIKVELNNDGTTFQNDEVWIEIEYPTNANTAYKQWDRTSRQTLLAAGANLTGSAAAWTEAFGAEVPQSISVTIGGGAAGVHKVWVCVGNGGANTVYFDPKVVVT